VRRGKATSEVGHAPKARPWFCQSAVRCSARTIRPAAARAEQAGQREPEQRCEVPSATTAPTGSVVARQRRQRRGRAEQGENVGVVAARTPQARGAGAGSPRRGLSGIEQGRLETGGLQPAPAMIATNRCSSGSARAIRIEGHPAGAPGPTGMRKELPGARQERDEHGVQDRICSTRVKCRRLGQRGDRAGAPAIFGVDGAILAGTRR